VAGGVALREDEFDDPEQDEDGADLPEALGDCCGLRRCVVLGSCVRSRKGAEPPVDQREARVDETSAG